MIQKVLSLPPQVPREVSLFSSNTLFGEPGIYPEGSVMVPAVGEPWTESRCRDMLVELVGPTRSSRFEHPVLSAQCPEAAPRAAVVLLSSTCAAPLVEAFLARQTPVATLGIGTTRSPGRVVGPVENGTDEHRVVNDRYQAEHPALMASSIAHDLLWKSDGAGQYEEATLHMLVALVHLQLIALSPAIAHSGTELARRQNSLAISLLNSRELGESRVRVIAPNGPGTIPGGAPTMQSSDFWSIPFVGGEPMTSPAPKLFSSVLQHVVGGDHEALEISDYDQSLGVFLSERGVSGALRPDSQLRAMIALGLLDETVIADVAGMPLDDVAALHGLHDVFELFGSR